MEKFIFTQLAMNKCKFKVETNITLIPNVTKIKDMKDHKYESYSFVMRLQFVSYFGFSKLSHILLMV